MQQLKGNAMGYINPDHGFIDEKSGYPVEGITSMACVDRNMEKKPTCMAEAPLGEASRLFPLRGI